MTNQEYYPQQNKEAREEEVLRKREYTLNLLRGFRSAASVYLNSIKHLMPSREVSLANTALQEAKMWMGRAMADLGSENPYPESMSPGSPTIEAQAESPTHSLLEFWTIPEGQPGHIPNTQVARVKSFRSHLEPVIMGLTELHGSIKAFHSSSPMYAHHVTNAILAFEAAKMWLGWELERIRDLDSKQHEAPNPPASLK